MLYKVLQYNINSRRKQKVIKPKNVYLNNRQLKMYSYVLSIKHKLKPCHFYITFTELSKQQIIIINSRKHN
jgi:hypothetical protein